MSRTIFYIITLISVLLSAFNLFSFVTEFPMLSKVQYHNSALIAYLLVGIWFLLSINPFYTRTIRKRLDIHTKEMMAAGIENHNTNYLMVVKHPLAMHRIFTLITQLIPALTIVQIGGLDYYHYAVFYYAFVASMFVFNSRLPFEISVLNSMSGNEQTAYEALRKLNFDYTLSWLLYNIIILYIQFCR